MHLRPPLAYPNVRSKVILLVLIYCLMYFLMFVGVLCLSLFCYALLCVHSSCNIILKRKRKLVALLLMSYRCIVTINVLWLFSMVSWVGLQCVIVVFPDHTHLLFCGIVVMNNFLCKFGVHLAGMTIIKVNFILLTSKLDFLCFSH